jgi:hypothetical protein
MGWQVGFDGNWRRDIGYGVPAVCDRPACGEAVDRGLSYVCGGEPYGGEHGCGLYFCAAHLLMGEHGQTCERCLSGQPPFSPTPDTAEWLEWKLTDGSWAAWRQNRKETP